MKLIVRRIVLLIVLGVSAAGFAAASGLDFHLGAGYHSSYVGTAPPANFESGIDTLKAMPLGIGGYVGLGYGFGPEKRISIGVEFAPSWDFSIDPPGATNFGFQGRAYAKLKPLKLFSVAVFGGFAGNLLTGSAENPATLVGSPILGIRATVFFVYAEYAAVLPELNLSVNGIAEHEIGIGFAIFK